MIAGDLVREIRQLGAKLLRCGLAVSVNPAVPVTAGDRTLVTWPTGGDQESPVYVGTQSAIAEYRQALLANRFTFALTDGALIQISCVLRRDVLIKHRYCYWPSPLEMPERDRDDPAYGERTLLDEFDDLLPAELLLDPHIADSSSDDSAQLASRLRLRSPFRFDFDSDAARPGHPAAHFTATSDEMRWPVARPLSVGHFMQFVWRHLYPSYWDEHLWMRSYALLHLDRTISPEEELSLFIECRQQV